MSNRFWVIGGEYQDTRFEQLLDGSQRMFGPYGSREAALAVWERVAEETRSVCTARFTVVREGSAA